MTNQAIMYVVASLLQLFFCVLFFMILLKKLLRQQRKELEEACENRIGELQRYYNHYGLLPTLSSFRGMLRVTSLGIWIRISSLKERLRKKDWNTHSDIEELCNIMNHEFTKAEKLADLIDAEDRKRLGTFKYKKDDTERICSEVLPNSHAKSN